MNLIECRGVTKTYGEGSSAVLALRGVDLDVLEGELLMLVGPSGSGKTTLISILSGILSPDGGTCKVLGESIHELPNGSKTAFRGKHIGFVFQAFNLVPALSTVENVAIPLMLNGALEQEAETSARELLSQLGLSDKLGTSPLELSGGQQQRVAIARGCIHKPELVVCDEPTSALDAETGHKVMELLRAIVKTEGRTVIVVTHDARIFSFADRIARMEDGRIVEIKSQM